MHAQIGLVGLKPQLVVVFEWRPVRGLHVVPPAVRWRCRRVRWRCKSSLRDNVTPSQNLMAAYQKRPLMQERSELVQLAPVHARVGSFHLHSPLEMLEMASLDANKVSTSASMVSWKKRTPHVGFFGAIRSWRSFSRAIAFVFKTQIKLYRRPSP